MKNITLAIETSCDDTSISILEDIEIISLKTFSQIKQHAKFGGVIPEVASRLHSDFIFKIIEEAIEDSGISFEDIDRIAVTGGPGFANTLQIGITVAKTLSLILKKPLYDINHIEGHAYSAFINKTIDQIPKKAIVLIASGGHSEILIKNEWNFEKIGGTKDDSIGEAYDKVSKVLGYGYPGGPILDNISSTTTEDEIKCPVSTLEGYQMSYSGLKSHVFNKSKKNNINKEGLIKGFQTAAIEQLILKVKKAIIEFNINNVIIGGGVSANSLLRSKLNSIDNIKVYLPKLKYTGDNAAMIGYLSAIKIKSNKIKPVDLKLDAEPRRKM
ncbi:MAG: tRNA (adenosine(37)-N6)-threonylcarbamoyltransferase complex transferase subunit TsaD [Mycoplasmataceae bacterium]|nr:tRNA (adenosine(37)-N6)-threonylcarbamoyltransferase complex transferase subunit TsaD [Mycoplasmataceae bacterium]